MIASARFQPLAWIAVLSTVACGRDPAEIREEPHDRVARGGDFTQEFVDRTCAQASAALEEAAGIRLREPVPVVLLTRDQALERRRAFAATLEEGAGLTRGLDLLGHVLLGDGFVGQYFQDEKVVYVYEDVLRDDRLGIVRERELMFATIAHELVHAYDDQVYGLIPDPVEEFARMAEDDLSELPSEWVLMALLEGHATWAAELACRQVDIEPRAPLTREHVRRMKAFDGGDSALQRSLAAAGEAMVDTKLLQYVHGREFCRRAMTFGGESFMGEVFARLPLTMDELADFERFKQRWAAEKEAEMEAADVDGVGALR